jgi:hypothetical protein
VIQESSEHGRISDTLTPGIRGDAGDHEVGLGGISTTGGHGIGENGADSGLQPVVSDPGSSSLPHSSPGSEVRGRKKLPVGVKG